MLNKIKTVKQTGSHMGGQGVSTNVPHNEHHHFVNKPTGKSSHPAGKSNSKGAKKFNHG